MDEEDGVSENDKGPESREDDQDPGPIETVAVGESLDLERRAGFSLEGPQDPGPIETAGEEEE